MVPTLAPPPSEIAIATSNARQLRRPGPTLIIVEGVHDVEFLRRLTSKLHVQDQSIPDLVDLERAAQVIFIPFGGGHVLPWAQRFAPLRCPEFHLFDRELAPETEIRQQAVDLINSRPSCRALLLPLRSLESYLHPAAIFDAGGGLVSLRPEDDIVTAVARTWHSKQELDLTWDELPCQSKRRKTAQVKRWLNKAVVSHMTLGLLLQMDPAGELLAWIKAIGTATDDF